MTSPTPSPVVYLDRHSGQLIQEQIMAVDTLRWLYTSPLAAPVTALLRLRPFSMAYGVWNDRRIAREAILKFAENAGIELADVRDPLDSFKSLNAFFARHLKPEARPVDQAPGHLISLGDGKLLVFPTIRQDQVVPVKGAAVTISRLLQDPQLAAAYEGGSALILRLAPGDYHRFHFVEAGTPSVSRDIPGPYDTVNPIGLASGRAILTDNHRAVSTLATDSFGTIATIEVGAMCVGSIVQTYTPGVPVTRGQEKGFFQFGGSTVIQLFEPGRVVFDADLVGASADGMEVAVRMGERIGMAPIPAQT